MIDRIDDFIQSKYQWISDAVFTYRDDVSPWTLAYHCFLGGTAIMNVYFVTKYPHPAILLGLIIFSLGGWFLMDRCQEKHQRWLNGKENLPSSVDRYFRILWLLLAIFTAFLMELDFVANMLIMSAYYFDSCRAPSNIEFRRLAHAGI
jgi:hypothetical protein